MSFLEVLKEYWVLFAGSISAVIWFARLEAGMLANRKKIAEIEEQRKEDRAEAKISRAETDANIRAMRDEMKAHFSKLEATLEKVIFRLGDKQDAK